MPPTDGPFPRLPRRLALTAPTALALKVNGRDVLSQLKQRHNGVRAFFQAFPDRFEMDVDESTERGEFFVRLPADFEQQKEEEQLMNVKQIGMADETTTTGGGGGAAAGVGADDGDADEAGDVAPVVDVRSRILAARTQTPPASQLSNGLSSHPAGRVARAEGVQ